MSSLEQMFLQRANGTMPRPTAPGGFTLGQNAPQGMGAFLQQQFAPRDPGGMTNFQAVPQDYYDQATGIWYLPEMGDDGRVNGFTAYDGRRAYEQKDKSVLNGQPNYQYDLNGNLTGQRTFKGLAPHSEYGDILGAGAILAAPFAAYGMGLGAGGAAAGGGGMGAEMAAQAAANVIPASSGAFVPATAAEMGAMGGLGASGAGIVDGLATGVGSSIGATGGSGIDAAMNLPAHEATHGLGTVTDYGTGALEMGGNLLNPSSFGLSSFLPDGAGSWLGPAASLAGGLLGSKGQSATSTMSQALDPRLDSAVFGGGGLVPGAQSMMNSQIPGAQAVGSQLTQVGSGLLGQTAPNTPTNPYVAGILDDLQRRNQSMLDTSFGNIRNNSIGVGGLGGSRQGVAQGTAIAKAADDFTGQAANLMGGLYNNDQQRLLQQQTLGAGLLAQGQQAPWAPLNNVASIYGQFKPGSTTTTQQAGGGALGALGGALGAAQFGKNMGWWG